MYYCVAYFIVILDSIVLIFFDSTKQGESVHFPEFGGGGCSSTSFERYETYRSIKFLTFDSITFLIADFRGEVEENCALLGYYAECTGIFLPAFRDNLSVPKRRYALRNNPEERSSQLHVDLFLSIKLLKLFWRDALTM